MAYGTDGRISLNGLLVVNDGLLLAKYTASGRHRTELIEANTPRLPKRVCACDIYLTKPTRDIVKQLQANGYTVIGGMHRHHQRGYLTEFYLGVLPELKAYRHVRASVWDTGAVGVSFASVSERLRFMTLLPTLRRYLID